MELKVEIDCRTSGYLNLLFASSSTSSAQRLVRSLRPSSPPLHLDPSLVLHHSPAPMDKKLQKMEKKLAAAQGLQVPPYNSAKPHTPAYNINLDHQVAAGVAKKSPADKQLQRDAKAIVKKSMVHACSASLDPASACSCVPTPAPFQFR